jgi:hypothetical protein
MDFNTETITVSVDYTLQVLHINKDFKSHVKSSQGDFLYSSVFLILIFSVYLLLPLQSFSLY